MSQLFAAEKQDLCARLKLLVNNQKTLGVFHLKFKFHEEDLVDLILRCHKGGFPITVACVRRLAFEYAKKYGRTGFNKNGNTAGRSWTESFFKRHAQLKIVKAQRISLARRNATRFGPIKAWFNTQYLPLIESLGLANSGSNIWNVDETGLPSQAPCEEVIAFGDGPCHDV